MPLVAGSCIDQLSALQMAVAGCQGGSYVQADFPPSQLWTNIGLTAVLIHSLSHAAHLQ
jgi:hypothetical protein